jgi:hypothetical protein
MKAAVPKSHSFTLRRSTEDANLVGRIANPTFPTKDLWAANRWMLQRLQKCNMVQTNMPVTKWEKKHTTCYIVKWCRPFMQRSHCFSVAWDRLLCCLLASNQWSKEYQRESSMPVRVRGGDGNGERKLVSKNWTSNIDWYGASCILHWKKSALHGFVALGRPRSIAISVSVWSSVPFGSKKQKIVRFHIPVNYPSSMKIDLGTAPQPNQLTAGQHPMGGLSNSLK